MTARLLVACGAFLLGVPVLLAGALAARLLGAVDPAYVSVLLLHAAFGAALLIALGRRSFTRKRGRLFLLMRAPEVLFAIAGVFFLFAYIYATNANMDYVQRFMASKGNLRLAPDSTTERLIAGLRYLPLLAIDAAWYLMARLVRPGFARMAVKGRTGRAFPAGRLWALPLSLLSAGLYALSFPSFVRAAGLPELGFVALIPLLLALESMTLGWGVFYGSLFGVVQTMLSNYWLGTFNLLTLQFVSVVTLLQYIPFMAAMLFLARRSGKAAFLVVPAAWTLFDWLRSLGFLGYPWGMLGASQYEVLPLIQIASLTGVWGVTFVMTLINSVAAWYVRGALIRVRRGPGAAIVLAAVLAVTLGWGGVQFLRAAARAGRPARTVRLALVQQNADPRKDDYRAVYDTLRRLTVEALAGNPDLVVWSETAFVPNIRRWSAEDPSVYPYAALVRDLLTWQKSIGHWLITGNDDYTIVRSTGERLDFNGAVLFSPEGQRMDTYHKMHLVPFTEYFPYKKQLPGIYRLLQSFDAYLWEPGERRVVFRHPLFSFATPICFEDVFPDDVRRFVLAGAQVIINLSNDYWSLTETEAMQHAANAVFRAVENGVPLARASASGLTGLVNPTGRIVARAPLYQESWVQVDVPVGNASRTLYTRLGDWFPVAMGVLLLLVPAAVFALHRVKRSAASIRGLPGF